MKRSFYLTIIAILINIMPANIFAETENAGIDMAAYATAAGYGFLIFIILFFSLFLYLYPRLDAPHKIRIQRAVPAGGRINSELMPTINIIYYSVISLIAVYIIISALLIF